MKRLSHSDMRSAIKRLNPVAWSVYLNKEPVERGGLFSIPEVEDTEIIKIGHAVTVKYFLNRTMSLSEPRIEFMRQVEASFYIEHRENFEKTFWFYTSLCLCADNFLLGHDPDIKERFPCWKISADSSSPLGRLDGKRFMKDNPIWDQIYPPINFDDNGRVEDSDGRQMKQPKKLPVKLCNPVDFLNALNSHRKSWWNFLFH